MRSTETKFSWRDCLRILYCFVILGKAKSFLRKTLHEEIKSILQQYPDDGQIFKVFFHKFDFKLVVIVK